MPNANYRKGYGFELHTKKVLEGEGWNAQRTAASHGPWDVMAVSPGFVLLVQCKSGGRPSPSDYKTLVDLKVSPHVLKMALWYPDGGRAARILYCADTNGPVPAPAWCEKVRWFEGEPPKIQLSLPLRKPRQKRPAKVQAKSVSPTPLLPDS